VEERGRREVGDDPDRWATVVSGWERGSWAGVWGMGWRMVGPNLAERHDGLKKKKEKRRELGAGSRDREKEREGLRGGFGTLNFCLKTTTHIQTRQMQSHVCIQTLDDSKLI
jgi:hypothetical protein